MIVRAALGLATERQLVVRNVAVSAQLKLPRAGGPIARSWTASELAAFLATARHHRIYSALHLAAHTGMRRGEIVGLKWCDLDVAARPTFWVAAVAGIIVFGSLMGAMYIGQQYLQNVPDSSSVPVPYSLPTLN